MNSYKKTNSILIILGLIFINYFVFVSFSFFQKEKTETKLINTYETADNYKITDSLKPSVITYSKLENFNENDTYFSRNIDNSNSVTTYSKLGIKSQKTENNVRAKATTYSKLGKSSKNPYFSKNIDNSNSVKTYTQLNNYKKERKEKFTPNVTSYTKIKKYNNASNYSKLNRKNKKRTQKFSSNVTTYTKLKNKKAPHTTTKFSKSKPKKAKKPLAYHAKKDVLDYHNKTLNKAKNINEIDFSPVYPGCENKKSERDKKNCLLTSVSKFSLKNFNNSITKEVNLSKGFYETRVLFVIGKNGYSKAYKVLGNWHPKIKNELKRIIRQLPKMKPGKTANQNIDVKYSIKLPFIVK